jgi:hypothetical protein
MACRAVSMARALKAAYNARIRSSVVIDRHEQSGAPVPAGTPHRALNAVAGCRSPERKARAACGSVEDDDRGVTYDDDVANRIRELIAGEPDVSEEMTFGASAPGTAQSRSAAIVRSC